MNNVVALFWTKGANFSLTNHFTTLEFTCKCNLSDCKEQFVQKELLNRLEVVRDLVKTPIIINSGYRCEAYQKSLRDNGKQAAKTSQHCKGAAADIVCPAISIAELAKIVNPYFSGIGIAQTYIHVDIRPSTKVRYVYN